MKLWIQIKKILILKKKILISYLLQACCSFYFGLIFGNLFGTFLFYLRIIFKGWDNIILFFLILLFEFLNNKVYFCDKNLISFNRINKIVIIQNIQLGLLFGFFIDAFKVGS